jgi:hypothetical protein
VGRVLGLRGSWLWAVGGRGSEWVLFFWVNFRSVGHGLVVITYFVVVMSGE